MSEDSNPSKVARHLFSKTSTQEKELANIIKKRNPGDKTITQLRNEIRDNYEKIIFLDLSFAVSKEVDQLLWKIVYYKAIEEFRKILKKYQTNTDPSKAASVKEKLHKTHAAFSSFLNEAIAYFENLEQRISKIELPEHCKSLQYGIMHKCFIILGDLTRYQQLYTDSLTKNWSIPARYYYKALELVPSSGNAHNQLAVVATYSEDEFEAVYRYFRSLSVPKPFMSARENLLLLFEQSRLRYVKQFGSSSSKTVLKKHKKKIYKEVVQNKKQIADRFLLRFVRLHGILFSKIGVETFSDTLDEAMKDFEDLLKFQYLSDQQILKIIIMCIFAIENSLRNAVELAEVTMKLVFSVVLLMAKFTKEPHFNNLGPVVVFLKYVTTHKSIFVSFKREGFAFWTEIVQLFNSVSKSSETEEFGMLPEDVELYGFVPIQISSEKKSLVNGQEAHFTRMKRAIDSAHKIADNQDLNIFYDGSSELFGIMPLDGDEESAKTLDFLEENKVEENIEETTPDEGFVSANFAFKNEEENYDEIDNEEIIDVLEHGSPSVAHSWASNSTKVIIPPSRYNQPESSQSSSLFSTSSLFAPPMQSTPEHQFYNSGWYPSNDDGYGRTIKRPDQVHTPPQNHTQYGNWTNQMSYGSPQHFGTYSQPYYQASQPFFTHSPQNGTHGQQNTKKSFIS